MKSRTTIKEIEAQERAARKRGKAPNVILMSDLIAPIEVIRRRAKERALSPSELNSTQRKRIARLQARVEEAEAITTAIQLMQIERWFPAELRKALIRFNRKIKKGGV